MAAQKQEWKRFNLLKPPRDIKTQKGVYVIWRPAEPKKKREVVYVGQGVIINRVKDHKRNPKILRGTRRGQALRVAWTPVKSKTKRDGIERHLADQFRPKVGERHPAVRPVKVAVPKLS